MELARDFTISQPAVTKHLNVLAEARIITRRREGRLRYCRLRPAALDDSLAWMARYRRLWNDRLDALETTPGGGTRPQGGTSRCPRPLRRRPWWSAARSPPRLALVYRAWSEPELAARWSWGAEHETLSVELDCRPGGAWKQEIRHRTNGERWSFDGVFQEVEPLRRLVHTFHWRSDRGQEEGPSVVAIEFFERSAGTEVVITHRRLDRRRSKGRVRGGRACSRRSSGALPEAARRSTARADRPRPSRLGVRRGWRCAPARRASLPAPARARP